MKPKKFKEIIVPILIIIALIGIAFVSNRPKEIVPQEQVKEISLPENWAISEENQADFTLKIEKKAEDSLVRPTIILIESEAEFEDKQEYVDQLIAGAKRTIPSLKLDSEKFQVESFSIWDLSGSYYTGGDRVEILQRIYLKDNKVSTLTASFLADGQESLSQEIKEIFDQIFATRIEN